MAKWKSMRTDIVEPKIAEHRGRLIRIIGDALFIEFQSAVDAVLWAAEVQGALRVREGEDADALALRIGINVEDVIVDDEELHGDGVNIASRIQQLANPGEVVVTAAVREYVWNKLGIGLVDMGERSLKNISRPIRLYRLDRDDSRAAADASTRPRFAAPHLAWANRPSIAVLPFRNVSGAADDAYFGEGITEDIIVALSRSRSMFVIARNSTLMYRNRVTDAREIANELGVKYVLEGTVRRQSDRLRISVELIDAVQNNRVWGEKYDGIVDSLFEFQDRIAASIVSTIEPRLLAVESIRARQKPTESLDAYDCLLRALSLFYTFDRSEFAQAGAYLDRATELDATYAQAYAYKAWWNVLGMAEGLFPEVQTNRAVAEAAARRAMALDDQDAFVVAVAGHVESLINKQPEVGLQLFDRALVLNENLAYAWGMSAASYAYLGEPELALERLRSTWRLSPFDPLNFVFFTVAGIAEFVAGRYDPAIAWLRKARRANPRFVAALRTLAASLALAGRADDAKTTASELLIVEPTFSVNALASWYPLRRADDLNRYVAGLRAAGLPE